ncbi:MAG: zinc-binding alcohol dehydrogenase family protein [Verrucomicrobiota bacterium]
MKAISITEPHKAELVEIDLPPAPAEGEVQLRIRQVGYCGSDLTSFRGLNPMVSYPRIPGHEIGATIEAVGPGVPTCWRIGQNVLVSPYTSCDHCPPCRIGRVNCCQYNETMGVQRNGAMTEFVNVPYEELFTSEKLGLEEMALVEPLTVGFHAVARGEVTSDDVVVVFGCGAIGLGVIAGASARKARVVAVDIDDEKLALARDCGATDTINSMRESLHDRLQEMTNGDGPNVMIEAVGLPQTFKACVEEVCFAGRVVYIGYAKAAVDYETKYFVMKELDIRGSRNALPEDFEAVIAHLESGAFPSKEVITKTVALEDAPEALSDWSEDPGAVTKIHVTF